MPRRKDVGKDLNEICNYIANHGLYEKHANEETVGQLIFNLLIDLFPDTKDQKYRDQIRPEVFKTFGLEYNMEIKDKYL